MDFLSVNDGNVLRPVSSLLRRNLFQFAMFVVFIVCGVLLYIHHSKLNDVDKMSDEAKANAEVEQIIAYVLIGFGVVQLLMYLSFATSSGEWL